MPVTPPARDRGAVYRARGWVSSERGGGGASGPAGEQAASRYADGAHRSPVTPWANREGHRFLAAISGDVGDRNQQVVRPGTQGRLLLGLDPYCNPLEHPVVSEYYSGPRKLDTVFS